MRRPTAITLLLLMLAAILAPAAVATVTTPMPACCRVAGAHHCSAMVVGATGGEPRLQGQSCPHRKPVACSGYAAPPAVAETVAPADAHSFSNEFQPEFFISHRELPYSQRGPPASAVK